MAVNDDVVNWITSEITTIGLADGATVGDEIAGGSYAPIAPAYSTSSAGAGSADITAALEFSGPANASITHAIFRRAAGVWFILPLAAERTFNSDGRFDLTTAEITNTVA